MFPGQQLLLVPQALMNAASAIQQQAQQQFLGAGIGVGAAATGSAS